MKLTYPIFCGLDVHKKVIFATEWQDECIGKVKSYITQDIM